MSSEMVNPLFLQVRPGTQDMLNDSEILDSQPAAPHNMTVRRKKRDTEMVIRPESHIDRDGHKRQVVNMVMLTILKLSSPIQIKIYINSKN